MLNIKVLRKKVVVHFCDQSQISIVSSLTLPKLHSATLKGLTNWLFLFGRLSWFECTIFAANLHPLFRFNV